MRGRVSGLMPGLLLAAASCTAGPTAQHPRAVAAEYRPSPLLAVSACGDFLSAVGHKPAGAAFIGCTYHADRQGKPLLAAYRVSGADAAEVEIFLTGAFGLAPLRFLCCGWESKPVSFSDAEGHSYSLSMDSDETLINTRDRWREIDSFKLVVESYTEEI